MVTLKLFNKTCICGWQTNPWMLPWQPRIHLLCFIFSYPIHSPDGCIWPFNANKTRGSPLKQERDSNKDSIAIYNDVVSNETAVLNTVDNKHLVLIPSYDGTKPKPSRESGLPIAIPQTTVWRWRH